MADTAAIEHNARNRVHDRRAVAAQLARLCAGAGLLQSRTLVVADGSAVTREELEIELVDQHGEAEAAKILGKLDRHAEARVIAALRTQSGRPWLLVAEADPDARPAQMVGETSHG